jgi:hypothetical protein
MERFNLRKLNEEEGKDQYSVEISNRFVASENSEASETIRENINISAKESLGYYELKKHRLWLNRIC